MCGETWSPFAPGRAEELRQRLAVHVLHHQHELAVLRGDVEHGHHVGVMDAPREARLVDEHGDELGILGVLPVEPLHGHHAREPRSAADPAEMHGGHPADGDLFEDDVATEHGRPVPARGRDHRQRRYDARAGS